MAKIHLTVLSIGSDLVELRLGVVAPVVPSERRDVGGGGAKTTI